MARGEPRTAQNNPVLQTIKSDSQDLEIGQGEERLLKSQGAASEAMEPSVIARLNEQPYDGEKMAMLAFMNEPVTIRIGTTTDKNAEQCFEININGKLEFFRRGETKTVPRYFVDRLLRLKETVFSQREVVNAEGVKDILHIPHTALKYDYSIMHDPNPLGASWEKAVAAEAG
jgi:hypothetical protein